MAGGVETIRNFLKKKRSHIKMFHSFNPLENHHV